MRLLLAIMLVIAAAAAHAQYPGTAPPDSPGTPSYPPVYPPAPPAYTPYAPDQPPGQPPTGGMPAAPTGGDARSLAWETLAPQNAIRATVGEAPLRWSDRLAAVAQAWAEHLAASGVLAHQVADPYGENLYEISGASASPQQVVNAWADEVRDYDMRSNTCYGTCGHYTQIIWRTTRAVGCGVAGNDYREVWVCEYDPPGNIVSYRPF